MLTRWPLTHASQAHFSPSINIADKGDLWCTGGDLEIRLLVGVRVRGVASAGLERDDEEASVHVMMW